MYITEMTIPWIGIQMNGGSYTRYGFSEETNVYAFHNISHTECQYEEDDYFSIIIKYEMDIDDNSVTDWEVLIKQETQVDGGGNHQIKMEVQFSKHPAWNTVARVDIPFRIDPDVYDTPSNSVYCPNEITTETSQNAAGGDPIVNRTDPGNEHDMNIIAALQGMQPTMARYYFLLQSNTENSQDPFTYDNNENIEDNNVVIWYVQYYANCAGQNQAPPEAPGEWTGIYCEGFEA